MGIKEDQLRRSFDLSAQVKPIAPVPTNSDGTPHSAETALDISIQQSLSWALKTTMDIHNKELVPYYVAVPLPNEEQHYRFTICMPDSMKGNLLTQPVIYDSMDRFVSRLIVKGGRPDILRAQTDYQDHWITLHYEPQHLLDTLHFMAHDMYRGNETILGHLYMAQHLMDWQKDYRPKLQIN